MASTRVPHQRGLTRVLGAVVGAVAVLTLSACAPGSGSQANAAPANEVRASADGDPAQPITPVAPTDESADEGAVVEPIAGPSLRALPPTRRALTQPTARPVAATSRAAWQPGTTLQRGARGPMVLALQRRLTELGYDPGVHDGSLGMKTRQALWAFQHVNNLPASGDVDATTSSRLGTPRAPVPFAARSGPTRVEVDIARQVAVVYLGGTVRLITHIS
ncbi:MAG: peptidoglycan-binding protein, partial [Mycobacteriales bacterium]